MGAGSNDRQRGSNFFSRRNLLKAAGMAAFASVSAPAGVTGAPPGNRAIRYFSTVEELKADLTLKENDYAVTAGYHKENDGGHAGYVILGTEDRNEGGFMLKSGLFASLVNVAAVNYKMFGALGDGVSDDGVRIKAAHAYAARFGLPVINLSGEYWIKNTHGIIIQNDVDWGNTVFHMDEGYNSKLSRFEVRDVREKMTVDLTDTQKRSFLEQLKPGVKVIGALSGYANCLIFVADKNDRIGFRSGAQYAGQSWSREEFFYVEEHGSVVGDIAWTFKDYTSLVAVPVSNTYLTIQGGTFYLSGNNQGNGYTRNGFSITRSRTIIRNQWVGLEPGKRDLSRNPRSGFYSFSGVYDVTLENVRLIPYEQNRPGTENDVPSGTYGISAARMLNGTFRNVTAEGSSVHWGVFGTNLNKNFRIESCRLNRVDVHFHCWNLYIRDSDIGYKGISVTGGGNLVVENSSCSNANFINFRRDFGSRWDGHIRIRNCRFMPAENKENSVLYFNPADFDYKYPLGTGRSVIVEDLIIDYRGNTTASACWLMKMPVFSGMKNGRRLFFPSYIEFRNILVEGREAGVRLMTLNGPQAFVSDRIGNYDGIQLRSNSKIIFDNVILEDLEAKDLSLKNEVHFSLNTAKNSYTERSGLYPEICFKGCKGIVAGFGAAAADVYFTNCSVMRLTTGARQQMPGKFSFTDCLFQPAATKIDYIALDVASELGTGFTNCTVHAPRINGVLKPELTDLIRFISINKRVRFGHLNTKLGKDIINYCKQNGIVLSSRFIAMLRNHHELEPETVEQE